MGAWGGWVKSAPQAQILETFAKICSTSPNPRDIRQNLLRKPKSSRHSPKSALQAQILETFAKIFGRSVNWSTCRFPGKRPMEQATEATDAKNPCTNPSGRAVTAKRFQYSTNFYNHVDHLFDQLPIWVSVWSGPGVGGTRPKAFELPYVGL